MNRIEQQERSQRTRQDTLVQMAEQGKLSPLICKLILEVKRQVEAERN